MKKQKLNFRCHNPNGDAETAEYITKIFIEAGKIKFEKVLQEFIQAEVEKTYDLCIGSHMRME